MNGTELHWLIMHNFRVLKEKNEHYIQPFCTKHGLTAIQLRMLLALHHHQGQTVSELARSTCMAGANASALCKLLSQKGLIHRKRDPTDERQVLTTLSSTGQALMQEFLQSHTQACTGLLSNATEEDMRVITEGLNRLAAVLNNNEENNHE